MSSGIGLDNTTNIANVLVFEVCTNAIYATPQAHLYEDGTTLLGTVGEHTLQWLEYGGGADTQTWAGDAGSPTLNQCGMYGFGMV